MSREADLYKDKIEVSLDGRQIFYLFFGGAVIVGLVFVLGVLVGRRVEARGHVDRARTTAAVDPLAALDRLEDKGGGMSFKASLMGTGVQSDVEQQIGAIEKARAKPGDHEKGAKPEVKPEIEAKPASDAKQHEAKPHDKHTTEAGKDDKHDKDAAAQPKPEAKKSEAKKPEVIADAKAPEGKPDAKAPEGKPEAKPEAKVEKKAEEGRTKYTLQLSSFQDRAEADAFLASIKSQGYQATVTEASVTGKTFYRVRMGSYKSIDAANDAKSEFEKASHKSATVMKL